MIRYAPELPLRLECCWGGALVWRELRFWLALSLGFRFACVLLREIDAGILGTQKQVSFYYRHATFLTCEEVGRGSERSVS